MSPLYSLVLAFLLGLQTGGILVWRYYRGRVDVVSVQPPHLPDRASHAGNPLGNCLIVECSGHVYPASLPHPNYRGQRVQ